MIKKHRTTLQLMLGGMLTLTLAVTACNNEKKEESKDAPKENVVNPTPTPAPTVKDSNDSMEPKTGNVAPGNDNKPVSPAP